ncbi:MAG: FkbM family methyltransferase [Gammaproteobacteria bacterium]|nr:FkbM family methyltransferase [Gammaproteobacteria bacterium]
MKDLLKSLVLKMLSPEQSLKLRRYYLAREVLNKEGSKEVEHRILREFLVNGDSVIDIGANVGAYTKEFSEIVGASGRVLAFEPVGENYVILETVVRKAGLQNVTTYRAALGAEVGTCDIVVPEMDGYTGYYWAHLTKTDESGKRESVQVHTLDQLLVDRVVEAVDFIKCDVEGGELDVVRGAAELLKQQRPGWLMEVSKKNSEQIFALFFEAGYQAYVYGERLQQTNTYRDKQFSNYFFFHPESSVWDRARTLL